MTSDKREPVVIVLADDDPDDCMTVREALIESRVVNELITVSDGEELMDYLHRRGRYSGLPAHHGSAVVLLDLNMPKKDGREALAEIKGDPHLRKIPVIILTTSKAEEDIYRTYDLGVNSYITKPVTFEGLVEVMRTIGRYWIEIVELPREDSK